MIYIRPSRLLPLLLLAAACTDQITQAPAPGPEPAPEPPKVVGVYEFTLTGFNGSEANLQVSKVEPVAGPSAAIGSPVTSGLTYELISTSTFIEGARGQGGSRYVMYTYRVRNTTGAPIPNLTLIPVTRSTTIAGTPFSTLTLFGGTAASAAIASEIVPSGAAMQGTEGALQSPFADVLQVFEEAEVSGITLPAGVTGIFPYGFSVRVPSSPNSRILPNAANANDYGGVLTFAFRYPLQATSSADPFTIGFQAIAVSDSETRLTESIEEGQDTAAVRRLRERATALGATTVTVLNGSTAMDPFVADYPGQRQLCSVRTAGTAAVPVTTITRPGPYTRIGIFRPGEDRDACGAYFTSGTPSPANYGMQYDLVLRQMDRYGNVVGVVRDTITLTSSDGAAVMPGPAAMFPGAQGVDTVAATYTTYGGSTLLATGRRMRGASLVFVNGMTRTWSGDVDTNWLTNGDWLQNMHPGVQDSVVIPSGRSNYPMLVQNTSTAGVTMTAGAGTQPFINLSAFDFTVNGNVDLGTTGTFTGTGRLILTGTSATIGGGISNFDVRNLRITETGRYSVTSNVNVTGGRIVVQGGRLRNERQRIRVRPS